MRGIIVLALALMASAAHGRDMGQWDGVNNAPEVRLWYRNLMRPDYGFQSSSCCGDADAYWCDEISVEHDHVFCAITDTRDDAPLKRPHRDIGTKIEIPPEKMKFSATDPQKNLGNPTGHSIIFLGGGSGPGGTPFVFCFVPDGGV